MPRRAATASACSTADSTHARRSSGRRSSRTSPEFELRELEQVLGQPVEPLQLLATGLEELRPGLRVLVRPFAQELIERAHRRDRGPQLVGHVGEEVAAPVAVAPDDLDALAETGRHRVELASELGDLGRAGEGEIGRDAVTVIALGDGPGRIGQAAQRFGEAARGDGRDDDREAERDEAHDEEKPDDVGDGARPERIWIGQRHDDRVLVDEGGVLDRHRGRRGDRVRGLAGPRERRPQRRERTLGGRHERDLERAVPGRQTERHLDVGLGDEVRQQLLAVGLLEQEGDLRVDLAVGVHDELRRELLVDVADDRLEHGRGPRGEVDLGLLVEVVVDPVDDRDRGEREGQGDDDDGREREARLECPRGEPAQHPLNARRTRTRLRGPSGRTPGWPGRPRSSRAGG